ncbi:MAG: flagella basal body P-ring formation protein FlgA [Bryobacteraceae bacterium]
MRFALIFVSALVMRAADCIPISGDHILGRDLASANPALASLPPDQVISFAPAPGIQRVLSSRELERIAGVRIASICFERSVEPLDPDQMRTAMAAALDISKDQIEILDYSRFRVPKGQMEFARAALQPSGLWNGRLGYGQGRSMPVWAKVKVPPSIGNPRVVTAGDVVQVSAVSGQAQITFDAKAQSGGRKGDSILVKNPSNGRTFRATVTDKGKVEVHPSGA